MSEKKPKFVGRLDYLQNPKTFEYDPLYKAVDVFIRCDNRCPFPFTNTNTRDDSERWWHQGFWLPDFINLLINFFKKYNLPYYIGVK